MTNASIEIVDYSPHWPAEFLMERRILDQTLGKWLLGPIEHIGSTAVPGLSAKPIIDIMGPVASLAASVEAIAAARDVGYVHYPYKPELMHWFCKPSPERRTHHLHLVPHNSPLWRERLAFRDALRGDARLRDDYQSLKLRLAKVHRYDRDAYTEAKTPFIAAVVAGALRSEDTSGSRRG